MSYYKNTLSTKKPKLIFFFSPLFAVSVSIICGRALISSQLDEIVRAGSFGFAIIVKLHSNDWIVSCNHLQIDIWRAVKMRSQPSERIKHIGIVCRRLHCIHFELCRLMMSSQFSVYMTFFHLGCLFHVDLRCLLEITKLSYTYLITIMKCL